MPPFAILLCGLSLVPATQDPKGSNADNRKQLEGIWLRSLPDPKGDLKTVVVPDEDPWRREDLTLLIWRLQIEREKLKVFALAGEGKPGQRRDQFEYPSTYKINAKANPKTFDITMSHFPSTNSHRQFTGIYELNSDTLRICLDEKSTEFLPLGRTQDLVYEKSLLFRRETDADRELAKQAEERTRVATEEKARVEAMAKVKAEKEKQAAIKFRQPLIKLKQAKAFLEEGKKNDAREYLEEIIKRWPMTAAAEEAKELLEKLKK